MIVGMMFGGLLQAFADVFGRAFHKFIGVGMMQKSALRQIRAT